MVRSELLLAKTRQDKAKLNEESLCYLLKEFGSEDEVLKAEYSANQSNESFCRKKPSVRKLLLETNLAKTNMTCSHYVLNYWQ